MTRVTAKLVSRTGNSLPNSGTERGRRRGIRERRLCRPGCTELSATSLGARDLVEEAEHGVDATVVVEDHDVEADNDRFGVGWAEAPSEAGLLVMCIDPSDRAERESGEPLLNCADRLLDRLAAGHGRERIGVARARAPVPRDQRGTHLWVGLVPAGQVAVDQVVHDGFPSLWLIPPTMVIAPGAACRLPAR